ncbi:MAG: N-6 DNA methylase [Nitrospirae bacterium]|nr:N-6 DNA methylase [Nitrospirota bacterium]
MQSAIRHLHPETVQYLKARLGDISDFNIANKLLVDISGIDMFFRNQVDFLTTMELLKPCFAVSEETDRREYGDFQTPLELADSICSHLAMENISPDVIIEPTFGKGSFLLSAVKFFGEVKEIYGVEIHEPYYWQTKFSILEYFINNRKQNKPKIFLYHNNVFQFDFGTLEKSIGRHNVLILGNPPWVTNSELGSLDAHNLPGKSNFKALNGLDAITGKGNFDICEYIILMMIKLFSKYNGHMAMLTKNAVIKNLIYDLPKMHYNIHNSSALRINAKEHFDAAVEASLFKCSFGRDDNQSAFLCKVSMLASPNVVENTFGWVRDKFVSDMNSYGAYKKYDGVSRYIWRQGIKHDCSKIMELDALQNNKYRNGLGQEADIEDELIYGLIKSSDLNSPVITQLRKYVIVTQRMIGESTAAIEYKSPKLYQYLLQNKHLFDQRKSSIYKNKPLFSIFGVGEYSFKPYKVAISGLYKRSSFSLILPVNGKPLMLDDTCYHLGFDNITEAVFVWAVLNSAHVQELLASITFLDAKRPYTKDVLMRLDINQVACDMTYEEIAARIESLDKTMLVNVNEDKWITFREQFADVKDKEGNQPSLFACQVLIPLPLAGEG